ncbi:DNA topoisomerase 3 [Marinobacter sp. JSM 1782161]|uniref:DNA topoisomerase III n=1 Tax=Marinobacter sp. JSM 1782161 TaxID=2685906 RepID=UPI001401BF3D|nr:DNA topoisomerase III [Marinobacter sp. JSM 1782161]
MRLFIAEKPSLGRAIASALPGEIQRGRGWLRCGERDVVTWCIGHLLEPAEPGHYDPRWLKWRLHELPIFPEQWELAPKNSVRDQLKIVEGMLAKADTVIHAGDPDREGQLLVDEVLRYCRYGRPVERLLIQDLTPAAVSRALNQMRDNRDFRRLSHSALARQRADWLYGINLTRAYTLRYQQQGQQGVYSVGRVQTPVLGLVVERDQTIADFEPKPFFTLTINCDTPSETPQSFQARWRPDERFRSAMDEEDRVLDRKVVESIAEAVQDQSGTITDARFRERQEAPPLPLSLSILQIEAGRLFGMNAKAVLDSAQNLYEKHQLITYPRSDCRYLPEEHFSQRHDVIRGLCGVAPGLTEFADRAELNRHSRAWDDEKVDAHHAIIPTMRQRPAGNLSRNERRVYELVARYYLMQFFPEAIHREGRLDLTIESHAFRATETGVVAPGWKELELRKKEASEKPSRALPRLDKGNEVQCRSSEIKDRMTQPPSHFTDATLLSAMTNIARFVADSELRKTLRDTDGLGTEATRASIIETLFKREYLYREGRYIKATDKGLDLIAALPSAVAKPDMTAVWESTLERIRQGEGDPRAFLGSLEDQIRELLAPLRDGTTMGGTTHWAPEQTGVHCPQCRSPMREREGKFGRFWACSRYPQCRGTRPIEDATDHADGADQAPTPCPACFSPLVRRHGKKGWFWGCSNYPGCRQTVSDVDGRPATAGPAG